MTNGANEQENRPDFRSGLMSDAGFVQKETEMPKKKTSLNLDNARLVIYLSFLAVSLVAFVIVLMTMRPEKPRIEAPVGNKIIYPENAPPRLEKPVLP